MTSTYRYVNTLVKLGYLEKDEKTKELRLGTRSLALGSKITRSVDELHMVKSLVDRIHDQYNITIDVGFAMDDSMIRVYHREAEETLIYRLPAVAKTSLHNTSMGKAYLATLSAEELDDLLERMELVGRTEKTIVDKAELLAEIEKARQQGYAMSVEEYLSGLITIGAPLFSGTNGKGVGAVSFDFSTLQHNAEEVEKKYAGLIVDLARQLSVILQGEVPGR
jgi:DNA-binding IclR family transcriptional regulator